MPRERTSVRLTNRLVQFLQRAVELLARAARQLVLAGIQQAVGEGVFARRVSGLGLLTQMRPAHDAVLMVAKQGLDVLRAAGHLAGAGGCRGVAKSLGALADSVQRL